MDATVDETKLRAMAKELAKDLSSDADLNALSRQLMKMTVETALEAEMDDHLGYVKHEPKGRGSGNSRNGRSSKTIIGESGPVEIDVPRDRNGEFDPQFVRRGQRRVTGMDEKILALYARGQSTRDIVASFKDLYDADISAALVSKVTDRVLEQVREWQARPLEGLYPIVYFDCIVLKVRQNQRVVNKSMYVALGLDIDGQKELIGLWLGENEGAKFWLSILTELKSRGLRDILIACIDGLKGFPEAIESVYPETRIQLCIVHQVRNSLKLMTWRDYKAVTAGLGRSISRRPRRPRSSSWRHSVRNGTSATRRYRSPGRRTGRTSRRCSTTRPRSGR